MEDSPLDGVSVQNDTDPPKSEAYPPREDAPRLQRVSQGRRHARRKPKRNHFALGNALGKVIGNGNKDKIDKRDIAVESQDPEPRLQRVPAPGRNPRRQLISGILLGLAVVFLGTTGWLAYEVYNGSVASGQRTAVLIAARQEALGLTTLSKATGSTDFDAVLAGSAGNLKQQLSSTGKSAFVKALAAGNVSSAGTVLDAGIQTLKPSTSATALLDVRATVTNSQTGKPETRLYHWQVSLVYSGGRWLVTNLEFV